MSQPARWWADPALAGALAAALPAVAGIAAVTSLQLAVHAPGWRAFFWIGIAAPIVEEIVFRAGAQDLIAARMPRFGARRLGPLTGANLLAGAGFCLAHLFAHPPLWALAMFLPALAYGWVYERGRHLAAPIVLHAAYNLAYLVCLRPG